MKKTTFYLIVLSSILSLTSCENDAVIDSSQSAVEDVHFVSMEIVSKLASEIEHVTNIIVTTNGKNTITEKKTVKKIENITKSPDANGKTAFYIINYEKDGYVLISADDRLQPILAFSEENNFVVDESTYHPGLVEWFTNQTDQINRLRNSKKDTVTRLAASWEMIEIQNLITANSNTNISGKDFQASDECYYPGMPGCCEDTWYTKGPLMSTTWSQGVGYNNYVPLTGCSGYSNGHAPTGCVATAMAQVMKYHQSPSSYNWSIMPNYVTNTTNTGANAISTLMANIGSAVNMNYGCSGSGANMSTATNTLKYTYGYLSSSYVNFNHNTVKQQHNLNRPVILSGGTHAWVTDGYRTHYDCNNGIGYLYLHMNWGWGGTHNAWYAYNDWTPGSYNFNSNKKMVYNITP